MKISDLYTRNLGLKILALILAVFLWFTAVGREMGEVGLNVPLELINFPENMMVANPLPDGISVRIRGSVALTRQIADRKLRFSLNLAGAQPGSNIFSLLPDQLGLPRGLTITRLTPSQITVELEKLEEKALNLLPVIKGEPVSGYIIEDIVLDPKQVVVRGPESKIGSIGILWTEPIDVTKLNQSAELETTPALPDVTVSLLNPQVIKARLKVVEKTMVKTFKDLRIEALNAPPDYSINPEKVDLIVRGPVNILSEFIGEKDINVRVNLNGLNPGEHERLLIVTLPPRLEVVKVEPKLVNVTIPEPEKELIEEDKTDKGESVVIEEGNKKDTNGNKRKKALWH